MTINTVRLNFLCLLNNSCLIANPCTSDPCFNPVHETPTVCRVNRGNSANPFQCLCPAGYTGKTCETRKNKLYNF